MTLPPLKSLKHVHIIGVCGTLMGAFAAFLKRTGIHVTGSDQNVYPPMSDVLSKAGVVLYSGYDATNLKKDPMPIDLVVVGNVISANNLEVRAAIDGGLAYTSLPEAMEKLMLTETRNLVVAGTHGKTTTSSFLAHTLVSAEKNPNYFIGGVSFNLPNSFHAPNISKGQCFVLEGDEYDTAFWDKVPKFYHYSPNDVILTSVEFDHADIYRDLDHVIDAFSNLMKKIRTDGRVIACLDFPSVKKVLSFYKGTVLTYGASEKTGARYTPKNIRVDGEKTYFEIYDHVDSKKIDEITIQMPGLHNVLNALAVYLECRELGVSSERVKQGLSSFQGVKRRQEVRGVEREVTVIDDFAHHPTAVRETLRALKAKYAGRKLITVFEPRSATSRRKVFQDDFAKAFGEADEIFIAKPYDQSKIPAAEQFSSDQLVSDISQLGRPAHLFSTTEEGVKQVAHSAAKGDVVAVLSNGGFDGFIPKLLQLLKS